MNEISYIQLLEDLIQTKQIQQSYDTYLLGIMKRPIYRKWMYEIILDGHKHEKMLKEIYKEYTQREIMLERVVCKPDTKGVLYQIEQRMEMIFENTLLLHQMSYHAGTTTAKQMFNEMVLDEQIHGSKLGLIYSKV